MRFDNSPVMLIRCGCRAVQFRTRYKHIHVRSRSAIHGRPRSGIALPDIHSSLSLYDSDAYPSQFCMDL